MVLEIGREALWLAVMLSGPILGAALAVGLAIGVIQAATQIQAQTTVHAQLLNGDRSCWPP